MVASQVACPTRFSSEERQETLSAPLALMEEAAQLLREGGPSALPGDTFCAVVVEALDHEEVSAGCTLPVLESLLATARELSHAGEPATGELCRLATFLLRLTRVVSRPR